MLLLARRFLVLFLLFSVDVAAQTPAAVQRFKPFEDMAGQITHITNIKEVSQSRDFSRQIKDDIESTLLWSGEPGYLFEVRIQVNTLGGHKRVIGGEPIPLGFGKDPVDIYTRGYSNGLLGDPTPTGFGNVYDPDESFFLWAEMRPRWRIFPNGRRVLMIGEIPPVSAKVVKIASVARMADEDLVRHMTQQAGFRSLRGAVERLRLNAEKHQAALDLQKLSMQIEETQRRRATINSQLNKELERSQRAEKVLRMLDVLDNILTVSSAWVQVSAALDDIGPGLPAGAASVGDVKTAVQTYSNDKKVIIEDKLSDRDAVRLEIEQTGDQIKIRLKDNGVPPRVLNSVDGAIRPEA